jgi:hypothetical protein
MDHAIPGGSSLRVTQGTSLGVSFAHYSRQEEKECDYEAGTTYQVHNPPQVMSLKLSVQPN